jgi:hypothetical protein
LEFEGLNPEERLVVEEQEVQELEGGAHDEECLSALTTNLLVF